MITWVYLKHLDYIALNNRIMLNDEPSFKPRSGHVGLMVDKVAFRQIFSKYFGFPCQFSFHQIFNFSNLSYVTITMGQIQPKYQETQSHSTLRIKIRMDINLTSVEG
jgi:hypothetical protein